MSIHHSAHAATLQQLFGGGAIDAGNLRFSDWQLLSLDSTAAPGPDLSQIEVLPIKDDPLNTGLQFNAHGELATLGLNSIDLLFEYRVSTIDAAALIGENQLEITGLTFGSTGGVAFVSEEVSSGGSDLGSKLAMANNEFQLFELFDSLTFSPQSVATVETNVFIAGTSGSDAVDLALFTQRFVQVPEPPTATIWIAAFGLAGLSLARRRIFCDCKNLADLRSNS